MNLSTGTYRVVLYSILKASIFDNFWTGYKRLIFGLLQYGCFYMTATSTGKDSGRKPQETFKPQISCILHSFHSIQLFLPPALMPKEELW